MSEPRRRQYTSISTTDETPILPAPDPGRLMDLQKLILSNPGATSVEVELRDEEGGSVVAKLVAAPGVNSGFADGLPVPGLEIDGRWTAKLSSATTIRVLAVGIVR